MDEREDHRRQVEDLLAGFASAIRQAKADDHADHGASVLDELAIRGVVVAGDPTPVTPPKI